MAEKSSKPKLMAANLLALKKTLALAVLALAYTAHAQQCGSQAGGALCQGGLCCSQYGYCGSTDDYCGTGCQSQCGANVRDAAAAPLKAPQCGAQAGGALCPDGLCCSQYGYCGSTDAYCGTGCQSQCGAYVHGAVAPPLKAPQCGAQARGALCPGGQCCSQYGYCGTTDAYCGTGCQSQCGVSVAGDDAGGGVASVVTRDVFHRMLPRGSSDDAACPDRGFYTYEAFLAAARAFPAFGATGDGDARRREVAAFMAQASHGSSYGGAYSSRGFCYKAVIGVMSDYCMPNSQFPCAPNKTYHERGPIQISYNHNYGLIGQGIGEDLLRNPDLVATDPVVAFKTALWLWMTPGKWNQPSCHDVITGQWNASSGRVPGYGLTTNILTAGRHCAADASSRVRLYKRYCDLLGVSYGPNLDCRGQKPFAGDMEAPAK